MLKNQVILAVLVLGILIIPFVICAQDYDYKFYDFNPQSSKIDVSWNLNNPMPASDLSYTISPNNNLNIPAIHEPFIEEGEALEPSRTEIVEIELKDNEHPFEYLLSSVETRVAGNNQDAAVYKFFKDTFENGTEYNVNEIESKSVQRRYKEIVITAGDAPVPDNFTTPATNDDGVIEVTWDEVEGAIYYELQENTSGDFTNPLETYYPDEGGYTVRERATGTYYYRIRTWMPNEEQPSAWSEVITVEVEIAETAYKTIEELIVDLDSDDSNVQIAAAKELYARGEKASIAVAREKVVWPRIRELKRMDPWLAHSSEDFEELVVLGQITIQPLRDNLYDSSANTDTRKWSVHLLGHIGRFEEVFDEMFEVKDSQGKYPWWIETEAEMGLWDLLLRQPKEKLFSLINDHRPSIRRAAINAFESFSKADDILVIDVLTERLLEDDDDFTRERAAQALSWIRGIDYTQTVETFIKLLKEERSIIRGYAVYALGELGDLKAVDPLIEVLKDESVVVVREDAIYALEKLEDPRAVEPLIEVLKGGNGWARRCAVQALEKFGDLRAVEPLIEVLKDESLLYYEREDIICALGNLGDKRAVEPLIEVLLKDDEYWHNRCCAAEALGKLGDIKAIKPLKQLLDDEEEYSWVWYAVREALDDMKPLYVPVNIIVSQIDDSFIRVEWDESDIDKEEHSVSYEIQLATTKYFSRPLSYYSNAEEKEIEVYEESISWVQVCIWVDEVQLKWSKAVEIEVNLPPAIPDYFSVPLFDKDGVFMVSWLGIIEATGYEIEIADNKEFAQARIETTTDSKIDITIDEEGDYWIRLRAIEGDLKSEWSEAKLIKIGVEPPGEDVVGGESNGCFISGVSLF